MNPIRIIELISILFLSLSCSYAEDKPHTISIDVQEIQNENQIIGKWAFSEEWMGYMGIGIEFTKEEYKYLTFQEWQ